ncbi:hypothetical protein [Vibrio sp. 1151_11]|nr:hypothetical protein [Vibrio sp. 1151_11]
MRKKHAISILKRNRQDGSSGANNHLREDVSSKEVINTKSKTITIPGDLTRPHHPEFLEELTELVFAEDLSDRILDTNLIERASQGSDPLENLRASGVLCDDPLETFS